MRTDKKKNGGKPEEKKTPGEKTEEQGPEKMGKETEEQIFLTDTSKKENADFSKRIGRLCLPALLLTGFCSLAGVYLIVEGILNRVWEKMPMAYLAWKVMVFLIIFCAFLSLLKIAMEEKPFSGTLVFCLRVIGGLLAVSSLLLPRLPGYHSSGFELFSSSAWGVGVDLLLLLFGLLFFLLANLIREGFQIQQEMDKIL